MGYIVSPDKEKIVTLVIISGTCDGGVNRVPGGHHSCPQIGELGCSVYMVSYIDRLKYIILLCMGTWIDATVTYPFLLKHDLLAIVKPAF